MPPTPLATVNPAGIDWWGLRRGIITRIVAKSDVREDVPIVAPTSRAYWIGRDGYLRYDLNFLRAQPTTCYTCFSQVVLAHGGEAGAFVLRAPGEQIQMVGIVSCWACGSGVRTDAVLSEGFVLPPEADDEAKHAAITAYFSAVEGDRAAAAYSVLRKALEASDEPAADAARLTEAVADADPASIENEPILSALLQRLGWSRLTIEEKLKVSGEIRGWVDTTLKVLGAVGLLSLGNAAVDRALPPGPMTQRSQAEAPRGYRDDYIKRDQPKKPRAKPVPQHPTIDRPAGRDGKAEDLRESES